MSLWYLGVSKYIAVMITHDETDVQINIFLLYSAFTFTQFFVLDRGWEKHWKDWAGDDSRVLEHVEDMKDYNKVTQNLVITTSTHSGYSDCTGVREMYQYIQNIDITRQTSIRLYWSLQL